MTFCVPFALQRVEELSEQSGIPLKIRDFTEWVNEAANSRANKGLHHNNNNGNAKAKEARKNSKLERVDRTLQYVCYSSLIFSDNISI